MPHRKCGDFGNERATGARSGQWRMTGNWHLKYVYKNGSSPGSLQASSLDDLGYERLYDALKQRVLAGQHDRLMDIKRQLRNDAVPSADADDYI